MSFNRYRIIFILIFMLASDGAHNVIMASDVDSGKLTNEMENAQSDNKEGRALFPRMEYTNEWTPVGRGDPLKDPTFDYMPPVLDRVRYWAEGTSNKNKNDILLLGVPAKKQHSPKKEKHSYGPIKRTYFSVPYQSHYPPPPPQHHHQPQQYHPQRMMPPPSYAHPMMSTHHYNRPPPPPAWNNNNIHHTEVRQESSIHQKTVARPIATTAPTRHPSSAPFLPTIPPSSPSTGAAAGVQTDTTHALKTEHSSSTPTLPLSSSEMTTTSAKATMNGQQQQQQQQQKTTKPLLHSILQTETAAPFSFTMKPSSLYQIEFTSSIYSPEAINSMATSSPPSSSSSSSSSSTTFVPSSPTKPSVRPMPTTAKMTISMAERDEQKHYVQPDIQSAWPVYNLIIEGHSKVKNYGLKNDDPLAASMPKIRPIQAKENPVAAETEDGPEFKAKQKSTMESLLSLLDGSFGNFLQDEGGERKTRSVATPDDKDRRESFVGVSFQVDERPHDYRRGTVISESLWPLGNADTATMTTFR